MIKTANPQCVSRIVGVVCPVAGLAPTGDLYHTDGP